MTRTARKERKKHLEASSWGELSTKVSSGDTGCGPDHGHGHVRKKKKNGRPKLCEEAQRTLKGGKDLVNVVNGGRSTNKLKRENPKTLQKTGKGGTAKKGSNALKVSKKKMMMREKRRLRRAKMKECFGCRQTGHRLEDCPNKKKEGAGLCFKCGSTEHGIANCKAKVAPGSFPFATCFICGEKGHLTRTCPDNPKGLYPHGGGCGFCGSVEHLKVNCPNRHSVKNDGSKSITLQLQTRGPLSADAEESIDKPQKSKKSKKNAIKTVKF